MRRCLLMCLVLVAAVPGSAGAQAAPGIVTIDVTATDDNGLPITTLRERDLTLRIDNRLIPVGALRLVQHETRASSLPAPYATNQFAPGRVVAIAVDVTRLLNTDAAAIRTGIITLLAALGPRDRVSLVPLAIDTTPVDLTTTHDLVRDAVPSITGGAPAVSPGDKAEEAAALGSLELLERLCLNLALEPGVKTVVYVAPAFDATSQIRRSLQSLSDVALRNRIRLFVIDPRATAITPAGGLTALAASSGGALIPGAGSAPDAFASIAARTKFRYELTFAPAANQRNGKSHRVQIDSSRPNTHVSTPPTVFIESGEAPAETMPALTDMVRESRPYRDLPLRLVAYPVRQANDDRLRLLILGETEDASRSLAWAEFALIDPSGVVVAQWKTTSAEAAIRPIVTLALAPPGPYRLRMAASELSGRRGAVDYEFDAGLTQAGMMMLGPVMFGGMADNAFVPQLQPAAGTAAIMAYTEIYGEPGTGDVLGARFEIARSADGDALVSATGSVRTSADPSRRAALTTLDFPALPPDDYLVRAIITVNDVEIGRVTRTLRLVSQ